MTRTGKWTPDEHQRGFFRHSSWLLVLGAVLLAIFYMGSAQSHGKGFDGKRGHGGMQARMEKMMDEVGVSDEQRTQIRDVMERQHEKFKDVHLQMRTARKSLHQLDPLDGGYDAEVQRLAGEVAENSRQMTVLMADGRKQVWQILNEEQRAKAEQLKEDRRQKFRERRLERQGAEAE